MRNMWYDVSKISGLPPFQLSSGDAVALQDKWNATKIVEIEETLRELSLATNELSHDKTAREA